MKNFLARMLLFVFAAGANAASTDDLLEPEKAFRMSARALGAAGVEVRFAIADGYYMYRETFRARRGFGVNVVEQALLADHLDLKSVRFHRVIDPCVPAITFLLLVVQRACACIAAGLRLQERAARE